MTKKQVIELIELLKVYYPDAKCSLNFKNSFEMVISVMLSAQCTDERVNKTTPSLFAKYSTPEAFAKAPLSDIEELIKPCGFHKTKAKHIKDLSAMLLESYNGLVPNSMNELIKLPGIGRKSANVIMLEAFNTPIGIAVDTHVKRVATRIGLSKQSDPLKIEQDLLKLIPSKYIADINHIFIWHGRLTCKAINPKCSTCPISSLCTYNKKNGSA